MSSAGISLFQRPLIVYHCGIYRQLAVVGNNYHCCYVSAVSCAVVNGPVRPIYHTSRPIYWCYSVDALHLTSCSTATLKCVYWTHLLYAF